MFAICPPPALHERAEPWVPLLLSTNEWLASLLQQGTFSLARLLLPAGGLGIYKLPEQLANGAEVGCRIGMVPVHSSLAPV